MYKILNAIIIYSVLFNSTAPIELSITFSEQAFELRIVNDNIVVILFVPH